jgi:TPR repeat protein
VVSEGSDQGDAAAQSWLGFMYKSGQGVPQDYAEATRWFRKAADQGHVEAQTQLGFIYWIGNHGVPKDLVRAHTWFSRAAARDQTVVKFREAVVGSENSIRWIRDRRRIRT